MLRAGLIAGLLILLAACGRDDARKASAPADIPAALSPRFYPPDGWAWGTFGEGKPQRYGVASPRSAPSGIVVILPGYGEPAEVWFETASNLIARGHTVWILDRPGQGGSARYVPPHDLGFVPRFDTDSDGLQTFLASIVKPRPDDVVVVLAHADATPAALLALGRGMKVDGLIANSAELASAGDSPLLKVFQRPDVPPFGWRPWSEDRPDDRAIGLTHDRERGRLRQTWMLAKPELRLSSPSLGWLEAFATASREVGAKPARLTAPILMVNPNRPASGLCDELAACRQEALTGARAAIHLETDQWREPWLEQVDDFVAQRVSAQQEAAISAASPRP